MSITMVTLKWGISCMLRVTWRAMARRMAESGSRVSFVILKAILLDSAAFEDVFFFDPSAGA